MKTSEIKAMIRNSRIFNYEIAEIMGMRESEFSKLFRKEIDKEQEEKIINAINFIKGRAKNVRN